MRPVNEGKWAPIISFIEAYVKENQRKPSMSEIARACGLSAKSEAIHYVRSIKHKGMLPAYVNAAPAVGIKRRNIGRKKKLRNPGNDA